MSERETALAALARRRANPPKRIDNASLWAGSPMYFYCVTCGHLAGTLPEAYDPSITPPPKHCAECKTLLDKGWL